VVVPASEFVHLGGRRSQPRYGLLREFCISLAYFLRKNFSNIHAKVVRWLFVVKLISGPARPPVPAPSPVPGPGRPHGRLHSPRGQRSRVVPFSQY